MSDAVAQAIAQAEPEARIRLPRDPTPSPLYRLLCLATLLSARIRAEAAVEAARALSSAGWRSARSMAATTWEQRVRVLNENGYARYDESTARMLGDTAELLLDRWGGDLRRLRAEADGDVDHLRALVQEAKGIGGVGADIFCREVQGAWPEVRPPLIQKKGLSGRAFFNIKIYNGKNTVGKCVREQKEMCTRTMKK